MKKTALLLACLAITTGATAPVDAQGLSFREFSGDTKLACEAIMCLSSGERPEECEPSIRRFFEIHRRRPSDTRDARKKFLKKCPAANESPEMESLASSIAEGAGRCDARTLNSTLLVQTGGDNSLSYISDVLPEYCTDYMTHEYTDLSGSLPRYVGIPERGGFWAEAADYDEALKAYNARIQEEDEQHNNPTPTTPPGGDGA